MTAGRGVALVQDVIRRDLLRESDRPEGLNIELIKLNLQFALAHDYDDVILERILHSSRYGKMIRSLLGEHAGPSFVYYYDLSFGETLRRHAEAEQPPLRRDGDVRVVRRAGSARSSQ